MENKVNQRVVEFINYKNFSKLQFCELNNINYTTFHNALSDDRNLNLSIIILILSQNRELNPEWLLLGNGNMIEQHTDNDNINIDNFKYLVDKIEYLSGKVSTLQVQLHNARNNDESK